MIYSIKRPQGSRLATRKLFREEKTGNKTKFYPRSVFESFIPLIISQKLIFSQMALLFIFLLLAAASAEKTQ